MLLEAMAYIAILFVILGAGFDAMYRCVGNSTLLRLSADDIAVAMQTGERWRSEVRSARQIDFRDGSLRLGLPRGPVLYAFRDNAVFRQEGDGPAVRLLSNVKASAAQLHSRQGVRVWTWELELNPRSKTSRIRPLFTFMAVHHGEAAQ